MSRKNAPVRLDDRKFTGGDQMLNSFLGPSQINSGFLDVQQPFLGFSAFTAGSRQSSAHFGGDQIGKGVQ